MVKLEREGVRGSQVEVWRATETGKLTATALRSSTQTRYFGPDSAATVNVRTQEARSACLNSNYVGPDSGLMRHGRRGI